MQNKELILKVTRLATEERRIGVEILELLQEIEKRKAYSELGYDGLFSFCVKELRYSEAQAARRIQAMRALRELPELKSKIQSGVLTVTTVSQVQNHLRKQTQAGAVHSKSEKLELYALIQNHSAKEVETQLNSLTGREKQFSLFLKLNPELKANWDKIKNLSAHKTRGQDIEVLAMLMDNWLKRSDPERKTAKPKVDNTIAENGLPISNTYVKKEDVRQPLSHPTEHSEDLSASRKRVHSSIRTSAKPTIAKRSIPSSEKREVWQRDQGQCVQCASRFALQYDHVIPYAKGGTSTSQNLRLLCRNCNLHAGIQTFGLRKMKREVTRETRIT